MRFTAAPKCRSFYQESQCDQLVALTNIIACHEVEDLACDHDNNERRIQE